MMVDGARYLYMWSDLTSSFQGQTRIAKLKSAYNLLIIGPTELVNLWEIMGLESSDVV